MIQCYVKAPRKTRHWKGNIFHSLIIKLTGRSTSCNAVSPRRYRPGSRNSATRVIIRILVTAEKINARLARSAAPHRLNVNSPHRTEASWAGGQVSGAGADRVGKLERRRRRSCCPVSSRIFEIFASVWPPAPPRPAHSSSSVNVPPIKRSSFERQFAQLSQSQNNGYPRFQDLLELMGSKSRALVPTGFRDGRRTPA